MLGKSGKRWKRNKNRATYVDDLLRYEFTPSEGIEQSLKPSMPCQEI